MISVIWTHGGFGPVRIMHRGGGNSGGDWVMSYHSCTTNCSDCTGFCKKMMAYNTLDGYSPPNDNANPYYAKCYDAISPTPKNGIRFAFLSQLGTTDIDPSLPQAIPYTNVNACLRMSDC